MGLIRIPRNIVKVPSKLEAATTMNRHILGPWVNTKHDEGSVPLGRKHRKDRDCSVKIMLLLWLVVCKTWVFIFFQLLTFFFSPPFPSV